MQKKMNLLLGIVFIFALSIIANAQNVTGTVTATASNVIKGAPYSADTFSETIQTLSDGNRIVTTYNTKVYRDSEGRTRTEQLPKPNEPTGGYYSLRETITITDPVAGFNYYLNPIAKTARQVEVKARTPLTIQTTGQGSVTASGFSTKSESSIIKTIEGIECTDRTSVTAIAQGAIGNEKELLMTSESCFSNELKTIILMKRTDLRFGDYTLQLKNIKRDEPDKSLFTIPSDYKLITTVTNPSVTNIMITGTPIVNQ